MDITVNTSQHLVSQIMSSWSSWSCTGAYHFGGMSPVRNSDVKKSFGADGYICFGADASGTPSDASGVLTPYSHIHEDGPPSITFLDTFKATSPSFNMRHIQSVQDTLMGI